MYGQTLVILLVSDNHMKRVNILKLVRSNRY